MEYVRIGQRIRNIRKAKGLTQEKLAELVDISLTHMSHIETGSTKLSLPVFVKIAQALHVSADELLFGNMQTARTIALHDIASLLEQCSDKDICILSDIIKAAKISLDKHCS